jgi:dUTP pyrophosphatase
MKVKIKKLADNAVIPTYATDGSAGMDLTATRIEFDEYGNKVYHTGLAFEIPKNHVGLVFPRSSNTKKNLLVKNSVGVIDSDYRGEVTFKFSSDLKVVNTIWPRVRLFFKKYLRTKDCVGVTSIWNNTDYQVGDRIGQIIIMPYPRIEFEEVVQLSETQRGDGGHGSTGR